MASQSSKRRPKSGQPARRRVQSIGGATPARLRALETEQAIAMVTLSEIKPRVATATRPLAAAHVVELAESIAALDLLEPLVVDRHYRLLAGAHRLAALTLLEAHAEERVRVLFDVIEDARERDRIDDTLCERALNLPS